MAYGSVSVPMTLSDLEGRDAMCQVFLDVCILNHALTVWHRATKFGRVPQVGEGRVSIGSDSPRLREWGPSAPNFWDPTDAHTV